MITWNPIKCNCGRIATCNFWSDYKDNVPEYCDECCGIVYMAPDNSEFDLFMALVEMDENNEL